MTIVTSGKVLVTGANGYIAVWVVKKLLDQGYAVRGTVRTEAKGVHLKELFKSYGDKFEVVVVADITKNGAFDEYVKDVDAIEHTASPFHFSAEDPNELIAPAVAGTGSILQSALQHGKNVKRVVVTGSVASVLEIGPEPRTFTEENWNEQSVKAVESKGSAASGADKYRASKTLAERAAWAFMDLNKDRINWDLVIINPPFVLGPVLHEVDKPENLNTSMLDWYKAVIQGTRSNEDLVNFSTSWVDVRDVAEAHLRALQKEEAGGNRIITSSGPFVWQEWLNVAHAVDPSLPAGNTTADLSKTRYMLNYNTAKSDRIFGIKYIGIDQCTRDTLANFKEKGWLP